MAATKKAATCAAAVAVLSTVPAKPAAGEQVIRPRQGKAGWLASAALSDQGFGRLLPEPELAAGAFLAPPPGYTR